MQKQYRFSIWYVLLGIWIVLIIQNLIFQAFTVRVLPHSQFLELLKQDRVAEVAISENQIQGRLVGEDGEPAEMFRTIRVDPEISQLLVEHNVAFKGEIESTF